MTHQTDPIPSMEINQSFAELFALEEYSRSLIFAPLHKWAINPIINFSVYSPWLLFFYCLADPISFSLSKAFASDEGFIRKSADTSSYLKAVGTLFFFFLAFFFGSTISLVLIENGEKYFSIFTETTSPGESSMSTLALWLSVFILLIWAGAQVINWGRFILQKRLFVLRLMYFGVFLFAVYLLSILDVNLHWVAQIFSLEILDAYWINFAFFTLLLFAAFSFWFWLAAKVFIWGVMLVLYLIDIITNLTKSASQEEIQELFQPVHLEGGKVFLLKTLMPPQLRSAQEWTKTRIEAINYRFVSISAFLALFSLLITSSTAEDWVNKMMILLINLWVEHKGLGYGEIWLGVILTVVIFGFVALLYNYWRSIVALNLIREACILIQYATSPTSQPQPALPVESRPQPWYKVSLIFLLTSLVFLFTSIIKDRRSK